MNARIFMAIGLLPPDVNSRLLQHPKCIVTPHVAAFSCDFEKNFFAASVDKLRAICSRL